MFPEQLKNSCHFALVRFQAKISFSYTLAQSFNTRKSLSPQTCWRKANHNIHNVVGFKGSAAISMLKNNSKFQEHFGIEKEEQLDWLPLKHEAEELI